LLLLLHDCMIGGKKIILSCISNYRLFYHLPLFIYIHTTNDKFSFHGNAHTHTHTHTHISPTGNLLGVVHTCTNDISFIGSGGSWNLFGGGTAEWVHNDVAVLSIRERERVCIYVDRTFYVSGCQL
jgi:hypothetical protein